MIETHCHRILTSPITASLTAETRSGDMSIYRGSARAPGCRVCLCGGTYNAMVSLSKPEDREGASLAAMTPSNARVFRRRDSPSKSRRPGPAFSLQPALRCEDLDKRKYSEIRGPVVRLSIGLEDPQDLLDEFLQALSAFGKTRDR